MTQNIIGSYFMGLSQQQSRVTAQAALITQMTSADNKIKVIFSNGIAIQNLFINQLSF